MIVFVIIVKWFTATWLGISFASKCCIHVRCAPRAAARGTPPTCSRPRRTSSRWASPAPCSPPRTCSASASSAGGYRAQTFERPSPWAQGRDGFGLTTFHKSHPSNSCPVFGAALAPLCSRGRRFLRCYAVRCGYLRRVVLGDHLRTLGGPAGGWSVPAVTPQAQDLTVHGALPARCLTCGWGIATRVRARDEWRPPRWMEIIESAASGREV